MNLSAQVVYNLARDVGFSPDATINVMGVCKAESNFDPFAIGINKSNNPTIDRGIAQFNSLWHPECTNEMSFTPALALREMFRVTSGGKDFSQWSTWTAGVAQVEAAKFRPLEAVLEDQYQQSKLPLPMPEACEFAETMVSAGHFRRMGLGYDGMIESDKEHIRWLAAQI